MQGWLLQALKNNKCARSNIETKVTEGLFQRAIRLQFTSAVDWDSLNRYLISFWVCLNHNWKLYNSKVYKTFHSSGHTWKIHVSGSRAKRDREQLKNILQSHGFTHNLYEMLTTQGGAHYRILHLDGSGLFSPARHWRLLGPQTDTTLTILPGFCSKSSRHSGSRTTDNCSTVSSRKGEGRKGSRTF